ncbi:hypothetical protein TGAM01_v209168 [Trichoderma gamsii]|uniref:Zn(2)-C6 fungal-type domain-containing protein n=1 Tax=Trichoderma gamsii TaxID=398673 RepID=A0A2P4ZC84_9HYPO|nr:hypothetical protein TGAM01_v209168 [Trichoderma gamsii]PON21912.1 hypothetical protein TGAM01_v209168 [Trichoderma gamsii]
MYKPAPPRPKKTNICRSRSGCKTCRQRRKKCDERKPCSLCKRLGVACEQISHTFEFRSVSGPSRSRKAGLRSVTPLYAPNPPPSKTVAVTRPLSKPSEHSPIGVEGGFDTIFDSDHVLSADMIPFPDPSLSYATENQNRIWEIHSDSELFDEPLDLGIAEGTTMNLAPLSVPQHRAGDAVGFYMSIWKLHCLPALNVTFKFMDTIRDQSSLITDTMATLAASRMSRKLPQRRLFTSSDSPGLYFRPDFGHEACSSELYGSALRRMSCWWPENYVSNPMLAFAALVLFCYVESSMGYFKGFYIHSQGIEELLSESADRIFPHGAGLLAAWVEVKMQNWWRRAYFGVPEFFQDYSTPLLRPDLQFISNTGSGRTATILWILCESHRLNTAALIACWARQRKSHQMRTTTVSTSVDNANPASEHSSIPNEVVALTKMYSEKLDEWRAYVPSLVEIEANPNHPKLFDLKIPEDEALCFSSHQSAMNMAYYVVGRVMHCAGPLQTFASASVHNIDDQYEEIEAWIFVLLRIAAGINWEDCICLNAYTIGETGLWIQGWLETRLGRDGIEEGNFPVFQILDAVRLINRERRNGLDVVALFQTVDDGGGKASQIVPDNFEPCRIWCTGARPSGQVRSLKTNVGYDADDIQAFPLSEYERPPLCGYPSHQIMRNVEAILKQAGSSIENVVEVTVFLTNIIDADELSLAYKPYWGDLKPARTCVAVKELPYGSDIELKCIAVVAD